MGIVRATCGLLLVAVAAVAGTDEESLLRDCVRRVICNPGRCELGPLLEARGEAGVARDLLATWAIPDGEFARLRKERSVYLLCALLDHRELGARIRAAESLAELADPRAAPALWVHGRRHRAAYEADTPNARLQEALAGAASRIGMEPLPRGIDFLVQRWLTPTPEPPAMAVARRIQREIDLGTKLTFEHVLERLPPAERPIAGQSSWRWYPLDGEWTVACRIPYKTVDRILLEPTMPAATDWGPEAPVYEFPEATPEEAARITSVVASLNDPEYVNTTPTDFGPISGPRIPDRAAIWDLRPFGKKIVPFVIRQLRALDAEGAYSGHFALRREYRQAYSHVIIADNHAATGDRVEAWEVWYAIVSVGVPRGCLAIWLRGARVDSNGDAELDYAIGGFGEAGASPTFADHRTRVTVIATNREGATESLEAAERFETCGSPFGMLGHPHGFVLGRFLLPGGARFTHSKVRLRLPPAPSLFPGTWSGSIESNTIEIR